MKDIDNYFINSLKNEKVRAHSMSIKVSHVNKITQAGKYCADRCYKHITA